MKHPVSGFFQSTLQSEHLISAPMHPKCRLAVLFPVYQEPARRVLELLESVAEQEDVCFDEIEILCLVNNAEHDATDAYSSAKRANEVILRLPAWRNAASFGGLLFDEETRERANRLRKKLGAYVIDKSSPGNEIPANNIGKARNRLLAEAVQRFFRLGRNGVVLMTDADAVLSDPLYLRRLMDVFDSEEDFVGGSGSIDFMFDPDTSAERERRRVHDHLSEYILKRRWSCLSEMHAGSEPDMAPPDACYGANIFFRSGDAAAMGGFRPYHRFEDSHFMNDLKAYASRSGKTAAALPHFRVQTALRDSFRTAGSFGHRIGGEGEGVFVRHPISKQRVLLTEKVFMDAAARVAATNHGRAFLRRLESLPQVLYGSAFPA